jgi:hypothetical protein
MKRFVLSLMLPLGLMAGCAHHAKVEEPPPGPEEAYPYHKPLSTPGMRVSHLPQVVQNTVLAEAGVAEVADVARLEHNGHMVYKVSFKESGVLPPLFVGSDGSVLNPDMTVAVPAPPPPDTVKFDDLPLSVTRVVQEKAPDAKVDVVHVEIWGDHTIYVVSFKQDLRFPKLYIVADGTVLLHAAIPSANAGPAAK